MSTKCQMIAHIFITGHFAYDKLFVKIMAAFIEVSTVAALDHLNMSREMQNN